MTFIVSPLPAQVLKWQKSTCSGANVQNHNSRTPPVIIALRRRYDWSVMWGRSEKCLLFSISSEDSCRMTIIYVCVCDVCVSVCVRRPLNSALSDSNLTFCTRNGSQWRESLCSAVCLDVIYCFSVRKKTPIQYVKIRLFSLRRNKGWFTFYILYLNMHRNTFKKTRMLQLNTVIYSWIFCTLIWKLLACSWPFITDNYGETE